MGLFSRLSSVHLPSRFLAAGALDTPPTDPFDDRFYMPELWAAHLGSAGIPITPELALTLSAMYSGVTTICYDLATLPCQVFKYRADGGKDRVRGSSTDRIEGLGRLVYLLRWQPNQYQTATEFWISMLAQWLLRGVAYAEIKNGGLAGAITELLPRHPDRVRQERLSNGRVRFKLTEAGGGFRYLTQDEMFVVRNLTMDGITTMSLTDYGAQALSTALVAERAAGKFFKSGMTAATVATYVGDMDDEQEDQLHKSITRYATGVENNFGLMLIPDNVTVTNLGVDPEKAQMMLAREWGAREVARLLRMPGHKLGIQGTSSYASQVQSAIDYVIGCLRPIAVTFEQAIQRDLVLAKDTYFSEFLLEALLRGDPAARSAYYTAAIQHRWMRPSEVRLRENMNPDPALDKLSEGDFRPGQSAAPGAAGATTNPDGTTSGNPFGSPAPAPGQSTGNGGNAPVDTNARAYLRGMLALHDSAQRCLRRERAAVEKLSTRYADDPDAWSRGLHAFYAEHAHFVATTLRMHPEVARGYAAQHGSAFEQRGAVLIAGEAGTEWERFEADELCALALADPNDLVPELATA